MKKLNLFIILFVSFMGNLYSTTYYVDCINGNDSLNSGKGMASAWKTIAKVNKYSSNTGFAAGDTISFKCGQTFLGITLIPSNSGIAGSPIVFNSYGTGDRPIIDKEGYTIPSPITDNEKSNNLCLDLYFLVNNKSYLKFEGLKFVHGWGSNIAIKDCSYLIFNNCNIEDAFQASWIKAAPGMIYMESYSSVGMHHITITNSTFKHSQFGHGLYINGISQLLMEHDTIMYNGANGLQTVSTDTNGTGYVCYQDTIRYCVIRQNDLTNNYEFQLFDNSMKKSAVYYNLIEGNITSGSNSTLIRITNNYRTPPRQVGWYNNTMIQHGSGEAFDWGSDAGNGGFPSSIDSIWVRNNVIYLDNPAQTGMWFYAQAGIHNVITNNLYYYPSSGTHLFHLGPPNGGNNYATIASWKTASNTFTTPNGGYESNSKADNPLFTNYTYNDYSLQNSSPAVFSGVWVGLPPHDIVGNTIANPPDIGAYQNASYLSGTISTNTTKSGNVAINGNVTISSGVNLTLSTGAHFGLFNGAFISGDGYMIAQSSFKIDVQTWDKALFRSMSNGHPKLLWGAYPNTNYGTGKYKIYRSYSGSYSLLDSTSNNTFNWTDTNVTINTGGLAGTYVHYYVVATNTNYQTSGQSNSLTYYATGKDPEKRLANNSKTTDIKFFNLAQNYPNPFNPTTEINYQMPKAGYVSLIIYDILGREVTTLVNEYKTEGSYDVTFNASGFRSGVYICRFKVNDYTSTKKMILLK